MNIMVKLEAKKHPIAEMQKNTNPIISNDLCLNRTLNIPINKAVMVASIEAAV
jgi:hypothetical protein